MYKISKNIEDQKDKSFASYVKDGKRGAKIKIIKKYDIKINTEKIRFEQVFQEIHEEINIEA